MTRTAARSSGASAAAGWPTFSGASDPRRQETCPRFARHAAPGSRGPASRQLGPRPSWRRRLNPWKREMRKTPSRSRSPCPMFDGNATDDDPPAPRLVVTDDAETGATVPSHESPVPEVGDAIVVLGCARLSATGRPNAATTQLATTYSAWRTITCAKAGINLQDQASID